MQSEADEDYCRLMISHKDGKDTLYQVEECMRSLGWKKLGEKGKK